MWLFKSFVCIVGWHVYIIVIITRWTKEQKKFSFNKRKEKLFAKRSSPRVSPVESHWHWRLVFQLAVFRHMGFYMNNNVLPLLIACMPTITAWLSLTRKTSALVSIEMYTDRTKTECIIIRMLTSVGRYGCKTWPLFVDKKNQLDVTFCILYFSSTSCSTCFGQPCAHHQELTTAWC